MAKLLRRHWAGQPGVGMSRRDRRPCEYNAYVPDPLVGRPIVLQGDVVADVADAERALARLDVEAASLADTEALARILLRAECVASSRIEGLEVGARRLLRTEAARQRGETTTDVTAREVLANIDAMASAVRAVPPGSDITLDHLLAFHRRLLTGTRLEAHGGTVRTGQSWIGGSDYNPCSAAFVPPPPDYVVDLLEDLCAFCNDDALSAVVQAAVAHAQFETIHPFVDGNGRTGRALIHLVLRRRGLATRVLPPISLVLATWATDYVAGLQASRYTGAATSAAAHAGCNLWVGRFAAACERAVSDAVGFEARTREIQQGWRNDLAPIRANSATDLLLHALPGAPVLSASGAAALINRSFNATNDAIVRLVAAGVLQQVNVGRRNRAFEAPSIIDAFTDLERQLASPAGDTRSSEPTRSVPRRRS